MRMLEGQAAIDEAHAPAHNRRNRVRNVGLQLFEHAEDDAAKPASAELALAGRFINRHDAAYLERLPLAIVARLRRRFAGIVQDFKLRLHDLQSLTAEVALLDSAVKRHHHTRAKLVFQVSGVEPDALQGVASLAHRHFKQRHLARTKQAKRANFGDNAGHLARAQLVDAARIQPVFVAKRQVIQQVFDRRDPLLQQDLGDLRANALHILNVGGEVEQREW